MASKNSTCLNLSFLSPNYQNMMMLWTLSRGGERSSVALVMRYIHLPGLESYKLFDMQRRRESMRCLVVFHLNRWIRTQIMQVSPTLLPLLLLPLLLHPRLRSTRYQLDQKVATGKLRLWDCMLEPLLHLVQLTLLPLHPIPRHPFLLFRWELLLVLLIATLLQLTLVKMGIFI